ncbi:RnfH family protein [Massilia sp. R2A-15]|uniref:RnfH family protein n=1 Tax=Massilia sp. R2A-15 TaxID=3064278 RepID=UPI002732AD02|nr:RnfH family protein [Massilia sp. R2A-15]WLI91420.1 RnfH family protein [Massilia sp. R2A-15]
MADMLHVSLCYATPEMELLREFDVAPGTTIEAALAASGVLVELGIDLATTPVGIYGKKKPLDTVLRERDRIELYRPLVADPKDSRRRRASHKKDAAG